MGPARILHDATARFKPLFLLRSAAFGVLVAIVDD